MKSSAILLACMVMASAVLAETAAIYDANPEHPWNRLSAALHTEAPLGFDPPGKYEARLLTGETYQNMLKALDDFLFHHSERLIKAPAKRAILQSELWATFDQVSDGTGEMQAERKAIARRCAEIIKRVALSDAEIAALPDTYATTVKSKQFPAAYDPEHRENAFIPEDLLVDGGPWVMLSASATDILQPAAIQHVKATQGRAVFYPLIRLPGGRQATVAYLRQLAMFPQPYVWNDMFKQYPYARSVVSFNPELPQFPPGTQVALLRRMVLASSTGVLTVTPITESIQLRVYVKEPEEVQFGTVGNQDFFELQLVPEELFKGSGGLRVSNRESPAARLTFAKANLFSQGVCRNCHGAPGVLSLNTYTHAFGNIPNTPWFEPSNESWQNRHTLNWKKRDYSWGLLSALLDPGWQGAPGRRATK